MKIARYSINGLYVLAILFILFLIGYVAQYLYASTIDAHHYGFNETWITNSKLNYEWLNGRWSQGFTNDHRFYLYRTVVTLLLNITFFASIWYFFKGLLKQWAFVMSCIFYVAFLLNSFNLYQIAYLLNTALSYTLGLSLMLFFYGYILRKGFVLSFRDYRTWLVIALTIFLTGLVEHLFLLNIAILGFLLVLNFMGKWRIDRGILFYFLLNCAGAAVTLFSPGLRKRRAATAIRNEKLGRDTSIDLSEFFDTLLIHLERNINLIALGLFLIALLFFLRRSELRTNFIFNKRQLLWMVIFVLLVPVFPIFLGYLGSNGIVGMPKAYNLFSFLILMSVVFLAVWLSHIVPQKWNKRLPLKLIRVFIAVFVIGYVAFSFFEDKKSRLYFQQRQVFSGDIKKPYFEELARRQYLLETYHIYREKEIPALSASYKGKVDGAHMGITHPLYYYKRFNNNIPIKVSGELIPPREYTTAFLVENNKLKPLIEKNGLALYYNKKLKVVVFKSAGNIFDNVELNNFSIIIEGREFFRRKVDTLYMQPVSIYKKNEAFYSKYKQFLSVELPLYTQVFRIDALELIVNTNDPDIQDKIEYDFDYGNFMR